MEFCNDQVCKISIEPALSMAGCFYVIVDDDPEHVLNQACISESEAWETAAEIRREIVEDSGQFGVGA